MALYRRALFRLVLTGVVILPGLLSTLRNQPVRAAQVPVTYPALSFLTARMGWVLAARGTNVTVMRTSDAGRSWTRLAHFSLSFSMPTLQFVDPRHGWISSLGPSLCGSPKTPPCHTTLLRTTDGGRHWQRLRAPTIDSTGDGVTFVDPRHGWLIYGRIPCPHLCLQRLYATSDGGVTWRLLPTAPRFARSTMSWVTPMRGWLAGGSFGSCKSAIYATTNGGKTWARQFAGFRQCGLMQVGMLDARNGWAVGGMDVNGHCTMGGCDDYALYRTSGGGKHWRTELAPSTDWWDVGNARGGFPGSPRFVTARYGWIPFSGGAGPGAGGIAITTNGGSTWRRVLGAYSLAPSDVDPINTRDGWVVGQSRLCRTPCKADLLHTTDGGGIWSELHPRP